MSDPQTRETAAFDRPLAAGVDTATVASLDAPATLLLTPTGSRYTLHEEIARGGMGVIYRATDTTLGRAVAVKVLQQRFDVVSGAARRFVDEARIAGQLQHPGIPAVHDLGVLPDGRPFLAMKLVKGRTLADLLRERASPAEDRGRFLAVFEQVCQAVGYAHAHQVIHRDLKPANVMVGAFGEVQVMDWGLAKVLRRGERQSALAETTVGTEIRTERDSDSSETQAGSVLGTPAYMPPEQAIGAIASIDARSDVFGLGAILLVILTGKPPFGAKTSEEARQLAARAKLDDAFARLDGSGADPDLVALCKRCLCPEQSDRPSDAGLVARVVADLRAAADERARQAELARARTAGEAREQRKRRRVQLALALAVGLLLVGGGAVVWWQNEQVATRRAEQANRERDERIRLTRNAGAVAALLGQCEEALRAGDTARAAVVLGSAERQVGEGGADDLADRLGRCQADLAVLGDLRVVDRFRWTLVEGKFPTTVAVAGRYREALRRFGLDPEVVPVEAAAARLTASAVRDRLVTALDQWLRVGKLAGVRAVLRLADPNPFRNAVRDAVLADNGPQVKALAGQPEAAVQPSGFVAVLGDNPAIPTARRRELLVVAIRRQPGDPGLLMTLGNSDTGKKKAGERARWFQATIGLTPLNSAAHNNLGFALLDLGDLDGALAELEEALRLAPKNVYAHNNLGIIRFEKGDLDGAIAKYKEALDLDPSLVFIHNNMGNALQVKGDLDGAITACRKALHLDPNHALAHTNLGNALVGKGDLDGAVVAYQAAIRSDPDLSIAHSGLGEVWMSKGDLNAAIAEFRKALDSNSKNAFAASNLPRAEQMLKLLPRLPDILSGRTRPRSPAESCEFADLCARPFQKRYAAAVRLYDGAFANDPELAEDLGEWHRYNAACYAVLAASGQGVDAADLKPFECPALRRKALAWLRADLAPRQKQAVAADPAVRKTAAARIAQWLKDADLAGTRPGAPREGWSKEETAAWDALWSDVRATLADASKPPAQPAPGK